MKIFSTTKKGKILVISLTQGELLLESINEAICKNNIKEGIVISGIGTLDKCVLHMVRTTGYPPVEYYAKWNNKALELVSIQGVIADSVCHLHAVVSDHKRTWAGHLEKNCRVLYLAEIVILETKGFNFTRIPDNKGIKTLCKKRK